MYKTITITILAMHLVSCGGSKSRIESNLPLANTPSLLVCSNPYNNNYPSDYMGKFQIPIPLGELDPSIAKRGISFKDYFGGTSYIVQNYRRKKHKWRTSLVWLHTRRVYENGLPFEPRKNERFWCNICLGL